MPAPPPPRKHEATILTVALCVLIVAWLPLTHWLLALLGPWLARWPQP